MPANAMRRVQTPREVRIVSSPKMSLWTFIGIFFSRQAFRTFERWFWRSSTRKYEGAGKLIWVCGQCSPKAEIVQSEQKSTDQSGVTTLFSVASGITTLIGTIFYGSIAFALAIALLLILNEILKYLSVLLII